MAVVSGGVLAGAAIAGGAYSARQAKKAAKAQKKASKNAIDAQTAAQERALELQRPQREAGWAATAALMDMTGLPRKSAIDVAYNPETGVYESDFGSGGAIDGSNPIAMAYGALGRRIAPQAQKEAAANAREERLMDLGSYERYNWQQDPGYQFRMDEGIRALDRSAAARGVLNSGGQGRALVRYGQDYASNEYQNVYNRLATIAGYGNAAVAQGSNLIVNTGANNANALINAGEAKASGYIAQGNAWSNAIGQVGSIFGYGFGG